MIHYTNTHHWKIGLVHTPGLTASNLHLCIDVIAYAAGLGLVDSPRLAHLIILFELKVYICIK
jgi:hypothetical protein